TLTGTRKQQVKTIAPLGAVTTFTYDPLGQLVSSSDTFQHATTYTYDMLGRLVQRVHPDAGTDTYTYDGAGNMTKHATQVLSNANKTIDYHYTYNRLDSIIYPNNPQNNVRYTYGDSTASYNRRGRIALLEDASGFRAYKYGKLGEVTEEHRTFVLPNESYQYSFKTQFSYDSWNRVQKITYPDGEEVLYRYNTGGMLDSVYGRKSAIMRDGTGDGVDEERIGPPAPPITYTYRYINHTTYNEFELKSGQWYGNGTHAQYSYDILQRLENLKLYDNYRPRHLLQDITYTYDKAGNITQISNTAGVVNTLGNVYNYSYTYDSLYRLTYSYGGVGTGKPIANYTLNMQYEADGRIIRKNQSGRTRLNGTIQTFNDNKSYTYNTSQPHTVQTVGGTNYQWDANGNMVNDGGSILAWDEENRLKKVSKTAMEIFFSYDAGGERFYKNSGAKTTMMVNGQPESIPLYDDPVLYASPYVVATPDGYTKHYFVESERFASRIGDGTITGLNTHATTASALAAKQAKVNFHAPDSIQPDELTALRNLTSHWSAHHTTYWQHSDHLGSASWVTDTNGNAYQHLQYMPWGEPLLDQRKSGYTYNTRYTFSGKERDEETGYSYFGARHYHPTLSIWLSVDPMSDKYPGVSPYVYCADNPVRLVDEDGREIDPSSKESWNKNKQAIIEAKASIDARINELHSLGKQRGWSDRKIKRETQIYEERSQSLQNTLDVMKSLEECKTETYILISLAENGYFSQGKGINSGKMQIAYSSIECFVHEVTHAGQYHRHEIGYVNGEPRGYDIQDEINAYRAAVAFNPTCYDNTYLNMSDITVEWVKVRTPDGERFPYKNLPEKSVNFNLYKSDRRFKYGPL
ncbi:MAG: hypothetical protein IJU33_04625, partial [Bacteroidales bacterium]|nr:hypothetical protein [Bacteroidales bacterium]